MQMYDGEAELSNGGIFELVYERFVMKNLTKRESWSLNIKKKTKVIFKKKMPSIWTLCYEKLDQKRKLKFKH